MAVIQIPERPEPQNNFASEVEEILNEVRRLRAMLDAWTLPAPPPPMVGRSRAAVIPINISRGA
jgi:hypothetical protein